MNKIYLISGIGCNGEVFARLTSPVGYTMHVVEWIEPHREEPVKDYLSRMFDGVEVDETDVILGVSLGGIVAQYMYDMFPMVKKIVLISTAISAVEMSSLLKLFKAIKIYRWIPGFVLTSSYTYSYAVMGGMKKRHRDMIGRFLGGYSSRYFRWASRIALDIKTVSIPDDKLLRIHGRRDILFPSSQIKTPSYIVEGATHLAVYTHSREINAILERELLF
ncbi:MAG: alpha/beta hydrolase [Flavobacteriales bacterium]|nr:alpha/beta hydrolase [Flavobacteriales bacterium]